METTKGQTMETEITQYIKNAVKFFEGQEYGGEPTSREEAIEIIREIVENALNDLV